MPRRRLMGLGPAALAAGPVTSASGAPLSWPGGAVVSPAACRMPGGGPTPSGVGVLAQRGGNSRARWNSHETVLNASVASNLADDLHDTQQDPAHDAIPSYDIFALPASAGGRLWAGTPGAPLSYGLPH
jgi:hypothetical protein